MKNITLNHTYTPSPLKDINQDLSVLLKEAEPDEATFLKLVTRRDDFIQQFLTEISDLDKENFVKAELAVNGALVAYANQLFKTSLKQLSSLLRGRKAVKKYK
ncbi:hypothetical protein RS130_19205 [Paraglaciecola aquimarina]|uniref:Orphan protein n=1 Tax=Paraglaciecola aquimarina TaxID=1235557 RepID=A0ABU3T0D2_9ALTE|nr:hypothetical protein [Paraglaciecola aquimarina]MDU0355724.1 hypothetical protein [Paraglaciecola aquimarina]